MVVIWKFSPAAFFGREGLGEVYSAVQVYLRTLGAVKILSLRGVLTDVYFYRRRRIIDVAVKVAAQRL